MDRKTLVIGMGGGLMLIVVLVLGVVLVQQRTSLFGRAADKNYANAGKPDAATSFLFASPLEAAANGREKVRVTVILLSSDALPVSGQVVSLASVPFGLIVAPTEQTTDHEGKAYFDALSQTPGSYTLSAMSGTLQLNQRVGIEFK